MRHLIGIAGRAGAALIMAAIVVVAGCNGGTQCSRDSDCASLSGGNWICATAVNHCVQLPPVDLLAGPEDMAQSTGGDMVTPADMAVGDMASKDLASKDLAPPKG